MRTRVYVAGPISLGPLECNIKQATDASVLLLKAGYAPLCPHLTCYMAGPVPEVLPHGTVHEDWYSSDLPWVAVSDAVLRLPGESKGADGEVALAEKLGIPVYYEPSVLMDVGRGGMRPERSGVDRFHALLGAMGRLHARKSADYGAGKDLLANVRASEEFGIPAWKGVAIRMNDKMTRIKSLAQNGTLECESVQDSFLDIAAYALIAHILFDEAAAKETP